MFLDPLHKKIHTGLALTFLWVVGLGLAVYIIQTIGSTDFAYLYSVEYEYGRGSAPATTTAPIEEIPKGR